MYFLNLRVKGLKPSGLLTQKSKFENPEKPNRALTNQVLNYSAASQISNGKLYIRTSTVRFGLWHHSPEGVWSSIIVFILDDPTAKRQIQLAMDDWSKTTCITFKKRTTETAYVSMFRGSGYAWNLCVCACVCVRVCVCACVCVFCYVLCVTCLLYTF